MNKLKRAVLRISLSLLTALLVFTVLSRGISRLLTPNVKRIMVQDNMLADKSVPPGPVVPVSCLYEDAGGPHVFVLSERSTLMGREMFVERMDVIVVGRDHQGARVDYFGASIQYIAGYPTKALFDGAVVEVRQ
ncbi:MAG: hypothetical protein LBJ84_05770 [Oscillospiraceae bacterium]|jgi:hypothetical protein|nr:hypothetical protein [Oscillospiraceae bacterium]